MRCKATTLQGNQCKKKATKNGLCGIHKEYKKSTDAEIRLRVATVAEMIIKGQSRQDIVRYGSKEWSISNRQVDEYISKAWKVIKESVDKDVSKQVQLALSRYEDLYKRSFNIQDYRECRQVQGDIVKLLGLAEAQKIDVTTDGQTINEIDYSKLSDSALDEIVNAQNNDTGSEG